ncbi:hypothetical protein [Streptomyces sp. NBC_00996]
MALIRTPFDGSGITLRVLRSDPVGVVLRAGTSPLVRSFVRLAAA